MSDNATAGKLTETKLAELTAQIVSAFVTNNSLPAGELPGFIQSVSGSFSRETIAAEPVQITPAVSIRKSVAPDHLVCLVCGKHQKTLKRHIATAHGLSPAEYRTTFGLGSDYPLVASDYAQARSEMAKRIGLGQKGRSGKPAKAAPPKAAVPKAARRGRPAKQAMAAE